MNLLSLPWLESSVLLSLLGTLCVSRVRDPFRAYHWGLGFTGAVFGCTFLAWLGFYAGVPPDDDISLQMRVFGRRLLEMDSLNAPLVPVVALLHFLTALATARTKMRRFSFSWSLAAETIRLATFGCRDPLAIVVLMIASVVPGYLELANRGKPTRVYVLHMTLFVGLLLIGARFLGNDAADTPVWAMVPVALAILIRCGTIPLHCWITDWFENASFGIAILYATPLVGIYGAARIVLPVAPDWILKGIGIMSLITAVYAAGMAAVQQDTRRFFAYLFLSHSALVLVGMELHTSISLTGALSLWFSVILSLGGFGLTLRALESRFGRLALISYHGLYEHVPGLAVFFLLTGLASVGFPGTLGYVSTELLVDGTVHANLLVGLGVVAAGALNSIAVLRAYLLLFTGKRHVSSVALGIGVREWIAVIALSVLILGGGLFPQPGIHSRSQAAESILKDRKAKAADEDDYLDFWDY